MWDLISKYVLKPHTVVFIGVALAAVAHILRSKENLSSNLLIAGIIIGGIGGFMAAIQSNKFEDLVRGQLTGGDSFCYIQTHFDSYGMVNFSLQQEGEYPLYDVNVIIRDITKRNELVEKLGIHDREFTDEEWKKLQKERDLVGEFLAIQNQSKIYSAQWPTLPPKAIVPAMLRIKLPIDKDEQKYLAKMYARNGTFTQPIIFRKVDGKWEMSMRVQKFVNAKTGVIELKNDLHPAVPLPEQYAGE